MEPRLVINVPPGSSKSMLVSVLWQAWVWGPLGLRSKRFLTTSFEMGNVTRDTRKTRDLILSPWFRALWPEMAHDNPLPLKRFGETSFENWDTGTREGVAFSGITGKRGDIFSIDDPHSVEGAESEADRTKAVRRFMEGGQNRLNNQMKSAIVITMQRIHMDDLAGTVLARDLGYEHLLIPMEYEPARSKVTSIGWKDPRTVDGELMDPGRMPKLAVERLKDGNDYAWAGQYQQRPAPREGGMFPVDKIETVEFSPAGGTRVRGWDIAGSIKKTSPYTAGVLLNMVGTDLYIECVKRGRLKINAAENLIVDTARADGLYVRQSIPQDPGSAGLSQKNQLAGRLGGLDFRFSPEDGKKEDRAIPVASQVQAGKVYMVRGEWNSDFREELRNFPAGSFKDQVDGFSRAYSELLRMKDPKAPLVGPRVRPPGS